MSDNQGARQRLRYELLTIGLSDWVSMAEVMTAIQCYGLAESIADKQHLVTSVIRSLLDDGLMSIGGLPDAGQIPSWGLSIDESMARLREAFIDNYDDRRSWDYSIWLGLTEAGRHVAQQLADKAKAES